MSYCTGEVALNLWLGQESRRQIGQNSNSEMSLFILNHNVYLAEASPKSINAFQKWRIRQESQTQPKLSLAAPQAEFLVEHFPGITCNAACRWQNYLKKIW